MKFDFKKFCELHKEKIDTLKIFLLTILGYGLIVNYMLMIIANVPFKWYGFPAFGIAYYFISDEFVEIFRKLRAKVYT